VSGAGGVMLNVQMTKMVADWFVGREIATAMAIFVNSWPAGIALSLISLPAIGTALGVGVVYVSVSGFIALALVLFAVLYHLPTNETARTATSSWPDRNALMAVIVAGLIWGLFNLGFAMIFSFGPSLLAERGWSVPAAGSVISIVLWLAVISVPLGGFLADRSGRPDLVLVVACLLFAIAMVALPRSDAVVSIAVVLGLISGLPAGPIMSLPARVLSPHTRSLGMGIFFALYYGAMMLGPVVAGICAHWTGSAAAALDFGAVILLACPALLFGFHRLPKAAPKTA
jgi:cyanate permease